MHLNKMRVKLLEILCSRWQKSGKVDFEQCSSTMMQGKLFSAKTKKPYFMQMTLKAERTKEMESHF